MNIRFSNQQSNSVITVVVNVNDAPVAAWNIPANDYRDVGGVHEGYRVTFWWRMGAYNVEACEDKVACAPNKFVLGNHDVEVKLPDPGGRWREQSL